MTDIRSSQRQLAPDTVGLENAEPTLLRALSTKASTAKAHRFQNLYGCLNEALLHTAWRKLNKRGAAGVDQETVVQYGEHLDPNIRQWVGRLKRGEYRNRRVRRKSIPKGNGKERPLGIPVVEDRLLQSAARLLLEAIFEADFHPVSYAYRHKKGAKDAVKDLTYELQFGRHGYVVEADIKGFFDTIDHDWLLRMLRMLREWIDDKPFLGLIDTWLKAGILETDGTVFHPHTGTPQGGVISPMLANIPLHYVLDLWFTRVVKPHCQGQAHIIRYADDLVCTFQYRRKARAFYKVLPKRLEKFALAVAPEKTCIHRFSRFHPGRDRRFTFLGFEFYWEADSKGIPRVWRRTAKKKLRGSVRACKEWLKVNRHKRLPALLKTLKRKVRGHYNYFRVVGNSRGLWTFYKEVVKLLYKWLNRRSLTWPKLKRVLECLAFPTPAKQSCQTVNRGLAWVLVLLRE